MDSKNKPYDSNYQGSQPKGWGHGDDSRPNFRPRPEEIEENIRAVELLRMPFEEVIILLMDLAVQRKENRRNHGGGRGRGQDRQSFSRRGRGGGQHDRRGDRGDRGDRWDRGNHWDHGNQENFDHDRDRNRYRDGAQRGPTDGTFTPPGNRHSAFVSNEISKQDDRSASRTRTTTFEKKEPRNKENVEPRASANFMPAWEDTPLEDWGKKASDQSVVSVMNSSFGVKK